MLFSVAAAVEDLAFLACLASETAAATNCTSNRLRASNVDALTLLSPSITAGRDAYVVYVNVPKTKKTRQSTCRNSILTREGTLVHTVSSVCLNQARKSNRSQK